MGESTYGYIFKQYLCDAGGVEICDPGTGGLRAPVAQRRKENAQEAVAVNVRNKKPFFRDRFSVLRFVVALN